MSRRDSCIGTPVERIEDLRFLRGRGQYIDDLKRDGLLHAAIVRSAVAHGRIRNIDSAEAREYSDNRRTIRIAAVTRSRGAAGDRARQGALRR